MADLEIHPSVFRKHPHLTEEDVRCAWENAYYEAVRPESPRFPEYLRIGVDRSGREIEMVGTLTKEGWLVYHANTPLSKRTIDEVSRSRRRR